MTKHLLAYLVTALCLVVSQGRVPAQERGQFYKKPETTAELWRYMNHEIELGNFKLAAEYLKGFIAKSPSDEELLQMQDREGSSAFLRLLTIPELQAEAKPLIERVDDVVQKHLSDRKRLEALIKNLGASAEERSYSLAQLRRSGAAAVPALIEALLRTANNPSEHIPIFSALLQLEKSAMPPLFAALDAPDLTLRSELIDVFAKKGEVAAVPHLWYFAASPKQGELLRQRATDAIATLLGVKSGRLPIPKEALTKEAEKYYQHRISFGDPRGVKVWRWEGKQLVSQVLTASQAEEYYGLRAARQALELDPTYSPAQIVFLSIALDKAVERAGPDQSLSKGAPLVKQLLSTVSPELIIAVLDRALEEHRLHVILAATRGLGDLSEVRAAQQSGRETPVLVRALFYPDRRVQLAAADALLRIPVLPSPTAAVRVVEILRRAAAVDEAAKALIADTNEDRASSAAAAVKQAGFEPVVVRTGRDAVRQLAKAADIDILLIDADIADPQLPHLLGRLRTDADTALLPLIITTAPERVDSLQRFAERYRNVWVIPSGSGAESLKQTFGARIAEAMGQPLSEAERRDNAARAMEWLARLARGEVQGYDIRPATGTILQAIENKELASHALEVAGRLPGREPQRALATAILDSGQPAALRSEAAVELSRHIQQYGRLLEPNQIKALQGTFEAATDDKLKGNLALVMGSLHPDARETGERLQRFTPTFTLPSPKTAPKTEPAEKKEADQNDKE